jgi:two-component system chemotaxis response regulator CheY
MKTLIVEDDVTSRLLLQALLRDYGSSQVAVNGIEAVAAVSAALESNDPYNLICLDIMMPEMDGHQALKEIRELESQQGRVAKLGARILMTTALRDKDNIMQSFRAQCDGYLVKPIDKSKFLDQLRQLELV